MFFSLLILGSGLIIGLCALPVRAGFLWERAHPLLLGITAGPFRLQINVSVIETEVGHALRIRLPRSENILPVSALGAGKKPAPPLGHTLAYLAENIHIDRLEGNILLSGRDAARDCIIAALLRSGISVVADVFPKIHLNAEIGVTFSGQGHARALGIFSCRFGHIMAAALIAGRDLLIRRHKLWKSIPSKAS